MSFEDEKRNALTKPDKSSKGSIDSRIKALCDIVNKLKEFYTTSSCAGRTSLIKLAETGKKDEAKWLYVTHEFADGAAVLDALKTPPQEEVWFRFEPMIMHIACKTSEDASKMLTLLHDCGLKRAGIIAPGDKTVIEAIGNEVVNALISKDSKLLVNEEYLSELVKTANKKMERNWETIGKVETGMKKNKK
jgi:tRNA wybutosine-synthesizing protein 3